MWVRIQELYEIYPLPGCAVRLDHLTTKMLRKEGGTSAKLRCYDSETRGKIPLMQHLVNELVNKDGPHGHLHQAGDGGLVRMLRMPFRLRAVR